MEWLTAILSSPITDKTFAIVLAFTLLYFMHNDVDKLIKAVEQFTEVVRGERDHQASRMTEIREFMRQMIEMWSRRSPR